MPWSPQHWTQSIQAVRSTLVQRDLAAASGHPCPLHGGHRADQEACRHWTDTARAHLAHLRRLAEQAPDVQAARERVERLGFWADQLPRSTEDCRTCCRPARPEGMLERTGTRGPGPLQPPIQPVPR
ncbi:hypothetical protein [Thiohalorhabdus methylotrophus]|uniref:Uncharacterized protein n=1 Tax=Thiohalorhabdus methylotrophus TaxID=3242694 RepID=A0ABV4TQC6_9GAMM